MTGQAYGAIAHRILAEIGPKTVIGFGAPEFVAALQARAREAFGVDVSAPAGVVAIDVRHDLAVCLGRLEGLPETEQRDIVDAICSATDDVLIAPGPGHPRSYWTEVFTARGFYLDADFDAGFVDPSAMRFRKTRAGIELEGRLRSALQRLNEEADGLYRQLDEKDKQIAEITLHLAAHEATLGWKVLERFRRLRQRALRVPGVRSTYLIVRRTAEVLLEEGPKEVLAKTVHKIGLALRGKNFLIEPRENLAQDLEGQYVRWLDRHRVTVADREAMAVAIKGFGHTPRISVLTVVEAGQEAGLARTVASLRAQVYPHWELCIANAAPGDPRLKRALDELLGDHARVRVATSDKIGPALATALGLAAGDFVHRLDVDDTLAPEAFFELVKRLDVDPALDVVYSDEDALTPDGKRVEPFFKPDWSPDLLLSTNYVARLGLLRRALVEEVGGFRSGFAGGEDYDLVLRATERTGKIGHVAKVLYHRRQRVPTTAGVAARRAVEEAEKRALEDALRRRGWDGEVEPVATGYQTPRYYGTRPRLRGAPLVSIIIPTRDKHHVLEQCIRSIRERTKYERYEIIVIDNNSTEPETLDYLAALPDPCRVYRWPHPFNFSTINNVGAAHAEGEQLLFLNNDTEVLRGDWLQAMLEHAQRPEVGAVGAKLLYPDGRIQHAGVVVGISRVAAHAFRLWPGGPGDRPRLADVVRNCSAVTAACLMIPRRVFKAVGGFDERLRVVLNDVDLCLKIRARGYLVVYTPFALLCHYEGASRGRLHPTPDQRLFQALWAEVIDRGDPYYNPNLTDSRDDWSLRLE